MLANRLPTDRTHPQIHRRVSQLERTLQPTRNMCTTETNTSLYISPIYFSQRYNFIMHEVYMM